MHNPFLDLFEPEALTGEEVDGAFQCQEDGCFSVVTTAQYFSTDRVLTWVCEKNHANKMEGFKLDG